METLNRPDEQIFDLDVGQVVRDHGTKLNWLIRLRWIAALGQLIVIPVGYSQGFILGQYIPWILFGALLLLCTNFATWKLYPHQKSVSEWTLFAHLCIDFVFFTYFLDLSSGFNNPLINLCFLHFAIVGLSVRRPFSIAFVIWAALLLSLVFGRTISNPFAPRMITYFMIYLMIGSTILMITQWFSETMSRYKESLYSLRIQMGRVDQLRASGLIAANLCHELATPLNHAVLKLDDLRSHELSEEKIKVFDDIESSLVGCGERLRRVFSDTSMDEQQQFINTDIPKLVSSTARSWCSHLWPHLQLEVKIPEKAFYKPLPKILFIRTLLDLLDNARAAVDKDHGKIQLTVLEKSNGGIEITVEDNGSGFSDEIREQIGSPFLTDKTDGVGLGLFTASHLAFHLGGNLIVSTSSLGGAKVSLIF
ncbi:MAG: HAMP domain-containing histidine kinase [Pseudobacteriovorax sp.]|nr:HAMP domain-containing histidine kinase [Pseudobacteriovorax sp.]